jgi:hypothetical protein
MVAGRSRLVVGNFVDLQGGCLPVGGSAHGQKRPQGAQFGIAAHTTGHKIPTAWRTNMTPRQAIEGIVELGLPDGGRVLVSFGDDVSGDADVENGVLIAMLAAGESQDDVCRAVTEHAAATGLRAVVSDRADPVMVVIESSEADGT